LNNFIDIIIPVFNSEKYIGDTLNSILQQDYDKYKVYIIDDCSIDNSFEIIKKFSKKNFFCERLSKNMGPAFCRNLGMRLSSAEYICFIDSDDLWTPDKLSTQLEFMLKEDVNFSYTSYKTFKTNNKISKLINVPEFFNYKTFLKNTSIATSSIMIRRDLIGHTKFKKIGYGFDDYIFKSDMLKKNTVAKGIQKYLTIYRLRKDSISSNYLRNLKWVWQINKNYHKIKFYKNIYYILCIIYNSLIKYRLKI